MIAVALAALTTGFAGSVHCVFMCGGLAMAAGGSGKGAGGRAALYQAGRLGSYSVVGALAGLAGSAVNVAGAAAGVSRVATLIAAVVLVMSGAFVLLEGIGFRWRRATAPGLTARVSAFVGRRLASVPPGARPLVLGAVTGLMPCGFLWTMVALAAGTASPGTGVVVMIAFGLGTLPATSGIGALAAAALRRSGRMGRALGGVAVIAMGLWSVWHRSSLDPQAWTRSGPAAIAPAGEPPCCHTETSP